MAPTPDGIAALRDEELEALRRQVVELQRVSSLGVLAGSVCHELNNALTPILNYAKLGLRHEDSATRAKAFDKILTAAQRAAKITHSVLGMARNRSDQYGIGRPGARGGQPAPRPGRQPSRERDGRRRQAAAQSLHCLSPLC